VAATADPAWKERLLFSDGLGFGIPALFLGTTSASVVARLSGEKLRSWADHVSAAVLVGVGLYLIWSA
jgi:threonine/homoserine/homoserine lactone efflux protein